MWDNWRLTEIILGGQSVKFESRVVTVQMSQMTSGYCNLPYYLLVSEVGKKRDKRISFRENIWA